jgi:hypothetical protein
MNWRAKKCIQMKNKMLCDDIAEQVKEMNKAETI